MIPGGVLMLPALINAAIGLLSGGAVVLAGLSVFGRVKAMAKQA